MLKITAIGNLTNDVTLKTNETTGKPYARGEYLLCAPARSSAYFVCNQRDRSRSYSIFG